MRISEMRYETVLVLRASSCNNYSHGGFQWPREGLVEAPDWDPTPTCGKGLHGWLWGEGDGDRSVWIPKDALWSVVEVEASAVVDLKGKVKFPRGNVVFCGDQEKATAYILERAPWAAVIGATVTGGNYARVIGGDWATVTGGEYATVAGGNEAVVVGGDHARVTGGDCGIVTGGDYATVAGGKYAIVTGGHHATVTGGYSAIVTGGDYATVTGGNGATVIGGDRAILIGGDDATMSGGDNAIMIGGHCAVVRGGNGATFCIGHLGRNCLATVGENGIKPDVFYWLINGVFTVSAGCRPIDEIVVHAAAERERI